MKKWPKLIKGKVVEEPDQVWISDITYIKIEEGNCYLNMITDVFNRKIVGYTVDQTMETESMIKALKMAASVRVNTQLQTVHHSDCGLQYCSKEYVILTGENNIKLSMTENSDPYENAFVERIRQLKKNSS